MVHWHCGQLHSAARHHANRRLIQQWQTFLFYELEKHRIPSTTRHLPIQRTFSTCSCRAEKKSQPHKSFDPLLAFSKKEAEQRIPAHITAKFDSHVLPPQAMASAMTIQSHLDNGDPLQALQAFETITRLPRGHGIPRHTAQQLLATLRTVIRADTGKYIQRYHRELELLLTYVRSLGYYWDDNEFRVILELLDRMDLVERAEVIFRTRESYCNQPASMFTYNKLAAAYLRRIKHVDSRERIRYMDKLNTLIQSSANHGLKPDVITFNLLLAARARVGNLESIEQTFDEMEREGVQPNDRTLNIALDIYGKLDLQGTLEHALSSILKSMSESGQSPDVITYATTIRNAVLRRDLRTAERTFKAMLEKDVVPNEYVFAHLVVGYVQVGDMDKAHMILQMMQKMPFNLRPTVHVFTPLIQGYAKSFEYDKAYSVFSEMVDQGIPANLTTYTILATMFVDSPIYENPVQAINVLRGLNRMDGAEHVLDQAALSVLIEAHGLAGGRDLEAGVSDANVPRRHLHAKAARECYDTIVQQYGKPDNVTHTVLLTAYARMNFQDKAWEFWQQLKEMNAMVTTIHYNALFMGLIADEKWLPRIKETFEEMTHDSVRPDIATYDLLIQGAYDAGDWNWIRTIWNLPLRPKTVGDSPDSAKLLVRTYYYALNAMLAAEDIPSARAIFKEFKSLPLAPASAIVWSQRIHKVAQFYPLDTPL